MFLLWKWYIAHFLFFPLFRFCGNSFADCSPNVQWPVITAVALGTLLWVCGSSLLVFTSFEKDFKHFLVRIMHSILPYLVDFYSFLFFLTIFKKFEKLPYFDITILCHLQLNKFWLFKNLIVIFVYIYIKYYYLLIL